ncbi:MAG: Sir2 silent information regulator family NAD-dependent deacetylase [Clostridiaceae bacterium]|nr:Sir2 silent information regulator family NAD-dependent deacetylase [Clostridiaceae bacterium]
MFSKITTMRSTENYLDKIKKLKEKIESADAILIGAGAGLSTSAGLTYSGERFKKYFSDFQEKYKINDMYSGGFYPFPNMETYWAWWSRHIYVNRYDQPENDVYQNLLKLVKDKDYFVLTTNVDHQFQLADFDKKRLFYTQGDYGLWQCSAPCHQKTYDNEEPVKKMLLATGFLTATDGKYEIDLANKENWNMEIPAELIPVCPHCGKLMTMNLRCDDTFVQDEGWYAANNRYNDFLRRHKNLTSVFLELGTGMNTPGIIKYNFWEMTNYWKDATYVCVNYGDAYAPGEIEDKSICIDDDIKKVLEQILLLL